MTTQNNQSEVKEIWAPCIYITKDGTIEEYPDIFVSNQGNVLNINKRGKKITAYISQSIDAHNHHGIYYYCALPILINGKRKQRTRSVHRLIMSSFDPAGWFPGAEVDHIVEVSPTTCDNRLSNLRWLSPKGQVTKESYLAKWYVTHDFNKMSKSHSKAWMKIQQLDPNDKSVVAEYESTCAAARALGRRDGNISAAAHRGCKAYGYYWRFV